MHHIEISKYIYKQAQLGVPHSRIQVELKLQLNLQVDLARFSKAKNYMGGGHCIYFVDEGKNWGGDTAHTLLMGGQLGWGHRTTLKEQSRLTAGWVAGWLSQ